MLIRGFRLWCLLTTFPCTCGHRLLWKWQRQAQKSLNSSRRQTSRSAAATPTQHHIKASEKGTRPTEKHA